MPKPTAQAMRTSTFLIEHDYVKRMKPLHLAALLDTKTRLPALIEALEFYANESIYNPLDDDIDANADGGALARAALQDAEGSSDA